MVTQQTSGDVVRATAPGDIVFDASIRVTLKGFSWAGTDKVAGDELIVVDSYGNVIWQAVMGQEPTQLVVWNVPISCVGIIVQKMTHGVLLTYKE